MSTDPTPRIEELVAIARSGDLAKRWDLSQMPGIPHEVTEILIDDSDSAVRESLALNYSVDQAQLARLVERWPELEALVASNPSAPPDLKDPLPLSQHVASSFSRYLDDRAATNEQRQALNKLYRHASREQAEQPTLGAAWRQIAEGTSD